MDEIDYDQLVQAMHDCFVSETENITSVVNKLATETGNVADAITPTSAAPGRDATGGTVRSLTEAVMGVTAGLMAIAEAISELSDAVRSRD